MHLHCHCGFKPADILKKTLGVLISNGNSSEWSPVRSVIIQVITKSDLFITSMITYRVGPRSIIIN